MALEHFIKKNNYNYWMALVLLFGIGLLQGCKKDSNEYQISYTSNKSNAITWYSDKVTAVIKSDSLLISGQQNDKSSIAIIVSSSEVGNYNMSVSDLKTVVAIDKDGTKSRGSQFISVDGVVSIIEKNEDKKIITGRFDVNVINLENINNKERIEGSFTSKYTSY